MKNSAILTPSEGLRTWQEIGQQAAGRAISPVARRNRLVHYAAWAAVVFSGAFMLLLGVWAVRGSGAAPAHGHAALPATRLRKVEFTTDGVLTEAWVRQFLNLSENDAVEHYDVFALQQRLLDSKQVREAVVERVLPGTLRITVQERRPWLRVAVDNGAGGFKLYLVSRDGMVFEGQDFPGGILDQLPWMAGLALHHAQDGGFETVAGLDAVADLLGKARASLPRLAAQWTVVDLSQFDPRPQAPVSLIKIRSTDLGQLTFLASDFQNQLDRLGFVAHELEQKPVLLRGLDLSLDNQVVVQPSSVVTSATHHPPAKSAAPAFPNFQ